jgi:hypothetical protein
MSKQDSGNPAILIKLYPTPETFLIELASKRMDGALPLADFASRGCDSVVDVLLGSK